MKIRERIGVITKLQSLAIFLVVLGHSYPFEMIGDNPLPVSLLHQFIYSFHMPLFMVISGFLFVFTDIERKTPYVKFVLKKAKRLLLPYLVLGTIAFVIKGIFSTVTFDFTSYAKGMINPLESPISQFWFLPTLFLIFLVAPLMKTMLKRNNHLASIGILLLFSIINILNPLEPATKNVLSYLVFFYLGCLTSYYFREKITGLGSYPVLMGLFLVLVLCNMFSMEISQKSFDLLVAIVGIVFSVSLAGLISIKNMKMFSSIDGYYYQIFLLSWFPQIFFRILYQMNLIGYYTTIFAMLVGGLFLPVIFSKFVIEKRFPKLGIFIGLK